MEADPDRAHEAIVSSLVRVLDGGSVVLFAGAGVSVSPPAGLPNWLKLRDWTLAAVAGRASFLSPYLAHLTNMDMLSVPGQKGMTPEVVASEIANQCSGYFESLRALDDGVPNLNHQTIAHLAKAGRLRAVVTTNFDVFIERALADLEVEFDVYRGHDEFSRFPFSDDRGPTRLGVLKIHGCLTRPETIIATVEMQARGLAEHHLFVLRWLQERYPFVYWGYSGWDLKINLDYLGTVSAAERSPGFFWSLHRDEAYTEAPSPYILELIRIYGSRGVYGHGIAPDAAERSLRAVGAGQVTQPSYTPAQRDAWREAKDARLRERLGAWAGEFVTENAAVMIFGSLLEIGGYADEALECFEEVQRIANDARLLLLKGLASKRSGDVRMGRGDLVPALECYRRAEALAHESDNSSLFAVSLDSIGKVLSRMGRHDEALACFREASRLAAVEDDQLHVGVLSDSIGEVHVARSQFEEALKFFKRAEVAYRAAGEKRLLAGGLKKQGTIYRNWREWDQAERCFREALAISRDIIGDADSVADSRLFLASLDVARGNPGAAYGELTALEGDARRNKSDDLLLKTIQYLFLIERNRGNHERADELENEYIRLLRQQHQQGPLGRALINHSSRILATRGPDAAVAQCQEAVRLLVEVGDRLGAALAYERLGIIYQEHLGQCDRAVECFRNSISNHRNVDQNPRQFVPDLLKRIADCRQQPRQSAAEIIGPVVATEPLIAQVANNVEHSEPQYAVASIYDVVDAVHKLAHQHNENRELCLRYLRAELPLATAIGYEQQIANIHSDIGWMHVIADKFDEALPLLRTAAQMSHDAGDTESEILHVGNLGFALARSGREEEGFNSLSVAEELARRTGNRARLLWLLQEQGRWFKDHKDARALPLLKEAIAQAEEVSDLPLTSDLCFDAGRVCRDHRQFEEALTYRLRGLQILELIGRPSLDRLLVIANMLENDLARPAEAVLYYERALGLCSRDPSVAQQVLARLDGVFDKLPQGTSIATPVFDALVQHYHVTESALSALANWARSYGCELLIDHPIVASRALGHGKSVRRVVGEVILESAKSLMAARELDGARTEIQKAEQIAIELGDREWLGTVRRSLADLLWAAGQHNDAMQAYEDAESVAVLAGNLMEVELVRYAMATAKADSGDLDAALAHIEGALAAAREAGYTQGIAHDLMKLADILCAQGEAQRAEKSLTEAIPLFREARLASQWIEASVKRADLLVAIGRAGEALEAYRSVETMVQRAGSALARRRLQEGIERASRLMESRGRSEQSEREETN
jgi:tetratricopeptide (TPR) repeat protein